MAEHIKNAQWIWCNGDPKQDEYGEFVDDFPYESGIVTLQISSDSNYATYINGELAAWGQYADFPYDKVYDEVDITSFCRKGKNRIATIVWYYGLESSSVYYPGKAGLLFALACNNKVLCQSSATTLSRMSPTYQNHRCKILSGQLGFGYGYDGTKEDSWLTGELYGFSPSIIVDQTIPLRIRPCDKLTLLPEVVGIPCKQISETDVIFDLGREQVGFLSFELSSSCEQNITIAYGEHLADGHVRRIIGDRDFSIDYRTKIGNNVFFNPFRRFGCRYLEITSEYPLKIQKIAIVPTMYVLKEKERPKLTALQNKIYDMCVETLHLCMHEHYEDCPWREQALYAMDSRNQMLCGYYAFGEYRFPRSNLELISMDRREDGLLSICYPIKLDLVIPSFSLHYMTACREYLEHSKDTAFIAGIYPKLQSIICAFTDRMKNGLFQPFAGKSYWNFYEWTENLDNWGLTEFSSDLLSNAFLSLALQNMAVIAKTLGIENDYQAQAEHLNILIKESFWDEEKGFCYNYADRVSYSQLGNAVAILCGAIPSANAETLCEKLLNDPQMTQISLSMRCFLYDALLKTNKEKYTSVVLENIEKTYAPMLNAGSTTVWETELGEQDFSGAGSLCHGWSAMPIYYYHILKA